MSSTTLAVPEEGDDEESEKSANPEQSSGPRKPRYIPTRDECLAGIAGLNRCTCDRAHNSIEGQLDAG